MGLTKRRIDRESEYGYTSNDKRVCNRCVNDKDIQKFIMNSGEKSNCDYCEKKRTKTINFNDFIEFILKYFDSEFGNPLNDLVNDEDANSFGIYELLYDKDLDITEQDALLNDIQCSLSDKRWCDSPYYWTELSDALQFGWDKFVEVVKHKSRYAFYQFDDNEYRDAIPPNKFLDALSDVISKLELYEYLNKGDILYRVRIHDKKEHLKEVTQLAPPMIDKALYPNRMSPAGIPMFYGAFDIGTAIKETYSGNVAQKVTSTFYGSSVKGTAKIKTHSSDIATIAKFKLLKDITLIDLSKIPPFPGFFEDTSITIH